MSTSNPLHALANPNTLSRTPGGERNLVGTSRAAITTSWAEGDDETLFVLLLIGGIVVATGITAFRVLK